MELRGWTKPFRVAHSHFVWRGRHQNIVLSPVQQHAEVGLWVVKGSLHHLFHMYMGYVSIVFPNRLMTRANLSRSKFQGSQPTDQFVPSPLFNYVHRYWPVSP